LALGKLADPLLAETVLQHVETCAECRQQVTALSGDDSLARLRAARQDSDAPILTREISDIAGAMKAAEQVTTTVPVVADLPPELRDHPQYEVLRELGRGGMGIVYLARNKLMDRLEVLKVVNKALLDRPGMLERFLREIRSAAKLNHPNVVTAYNAMQVGDLLAFAMEYVPGEDLAHVVKSYGGPLPVLNACYYIQQVLLGLQHAHERGMVHRDIKPQNLILAKEEKKHVVKILDFGLAKARSERGSQNELTGTGQMLGTPDYIAPEQSLDAASADIRADIYSLGCTLYYLLAGHAPFKGRSLFEILQAHQSQVAKPLTEERSEVPPGLAAIVAKMMAKAPEDRYQTPVEVAQAILPFLKSGGKGTKASVTPVKPSPAAKPTHVKKGQPQGLVEAIAEAVRQETIGGGPSTVGEVRSRPVARPRRAQAQKPAGVNRKWLFLGAGLVAVLLISLVAWWASSGVRVKTKDGVIVLNDLPAEAEVLVDGDKVTVTWDKEGKKAGISIKPGTHKIVVSLNDKTTVIGEQIEVISGGTIAFTVHAEELKKTPEIQSSKLQEPRADGFVSLFNGKDLTGWVGDTKSWRAENGMLIAQGEDANTRSFLLSERQYANFVLRLEFSLESGSSSGVSIRAILGESLRLNDKSVPDHPVFRLTDAPELAETGSTKWILNSPDIVPPSKSAEMKPPGSWNHLELEVDGHSMKARVNGRLVFDSTLAAGALLPDRTVPALNRSAGRIGLQKHTKTVRFRNIEIKELAATAAVTTPAPPVVSAPAPVLNAPGLFFNGKDLTGWYGLEGYWRVEDGAIVGRPPPGKPEHTFLISDKTYRNFDLRFDVRRTDGTGNSGVQFRSLVKDRVKCTVIGPQCEIDSANFTYPPGSMVTEPNLEPFALKARPEVAQKYKDADWNDFHIRCLGKHVLIEVNGVTAIDGSYPELPDEGVIAFQIHGGRPAREITFRNIEFRELGGATQADGFVSLFNGKDLTGWKTHPKQPGNWRVVAGTGGDVLTGSGPAASHLYTERGDYRDFHLRVEARINDKGNSGLLFRTTFGPQFPAKNHVFPLGYEAQINSTHADVNKTGSLYVGSDGALVSVRDMLVPPNQWFTLEVVAQDNLIVVKVNGKETAHFHDDKRRFASGHIALQQHDPQTVTEFRKIEIRELKATAAVEERKPGAGADPFPEGSVWKGTRSYRKGMWAGNTVTYEVRVLSRSGEKFRGVKFDNGAGRNRLEIQGEIRGNVITWIESGISFRGELDKDTIHVTFKSPKVEGDGILKR
jgi:serine/threonine protein kinase